MLYCLQNFSKSNMILIFFIYNLQHMKYKLEAKSLKLFQRILQIGEPGDKTVRKNLKHLTFRISIFLKVLQFYHVVFWWFKNTFSIISFNLFKTENDNSIKLKFYVHWKYHVIISVIDSEARVKKLLRTQAIFIHP